MQFPPLLKFFNYNLVNSCVLNFSLQNSAVTLELSFLKVRLMTVTVILWRSNIPISTTGEL